MRGILVRVGIDSTAGGWNAPVDPKSGDFVYVPIPETETVDSRYERNYEEMASPLARFRFELPTYLKGSRMHLDPDFEYLTYGDVPPRSKPILGLNGGDILAFYAGLRSIWSRDNQLVYALIGLYVVDRVVKADSFPENQRHQNAHTRRNEPRDSVIVVAKPRVSGRLTRCIPIGEYRERAYRVRRDILEDWGGIDVRDGYIQRSGRLPSFLDPGSFLEWFHRQGIELIGRNNR